jgi:DNA polymerase III gamma/tau subunit
MQYQQAQMQAQQQPPQPGQPAPQMPPPPPDVPAWEEIVQVLRDDAQRSYKIDIETDSTIAATVDQDMQSLQQVTQAMGVVLKEFMPLVQMGDLPIDAMKELLMTISRRARFGNALEDALDKMQQPPPKPQEQDNSAQVAQIKAQSDQQAQQADQQHSAQLEQMKMQHEAQMEQGKQQGAAMVEQMRMEHASQLAQAQTSFDEWKAKLDAETKIAVAEIAASTSLKSQQMGIEAKDGMEVDEEGNTKPGKAVSAVADSMKAELGDVISMVNEQLQQLLEAQSTPRTIERGPDGRAISVGGRMIQRGPDNRIIGVQ